MKHKSILSALVIGFLLGLASSHFGKWFQTICYVTYSPDGAFRLEAVRNSFFPANMPGQGGDGKGYVRLVNSYTGRVEKKSGLLPQISSFSAHSFQWSERSVELKLDTLPDTHSETWELAR